MFVKPCGFKHEQKKINNLELIEEFKKIHNERLEQALNECLERIKSRSYQYINTPVLDGWINNLAVIGNEDRDKMMSYLDHFVHQRVMDGLRTMYYQKKYFELPESVLPSDKDTFKLRWGDCGQEHEFIDDEFDNVFIFDDTKKKEPIKIRTEKIID